MQNFPTVIIALIVISVISACQTTREEAPLPTRARLPTITASPIPEIVATDTATATLTATSTASATSTITATPTITPTQLVTVATTPPIIAVSTVVVITIAPTNPLPPTPQRAFATPLPETFIFGQSAGGNNLVGYRYGTGQNVIMLVGGIHAGYESNSSDLMNELRTHYSNNPSQIMSDVSLIIIPEFNADGVQYGRVLRGRFNANGVDLNRNWGCDWEPTAYFQDNVVFPGNEPFSEPETKALGSLIQRVQPMAVLFYHAAADGVFSGTCGGQRTASDDLAQIYGSVSGYRSGATFSSYPVSGTAPEWVDSQGIPAVDVELRTATETDFARNLQGVNAVQQWVSGR